MDESRDSERNRRAWDAESDAYQALHGAQLRAVPKGWGVWSFPESELRLLGDVAGRDVLEYGCGGAQWSIALAREGARVTGLDNSGRQLEHARRAAREAGLDIPFVLCAAERTPFAAASFDVVFCDHGAMSFAAPEATIPEVSRILRPGGILAFSVEHPLHAVSCDRNDAPTRGFRTPYFELERFGDAGGGGAVSHARPISSYVTLLLDHGFKLERLLEPRPQPDAVTTYGEFAPHDWSRDYPAELIIRCRRSLG